MFGVRLFGQGQHGLGPARMPTTPKHPPKTRKAKPHRPWKPIRVYINPVWTSIHQGARIPTHPTSPAADPPKTPKTTCRKSVRSPTGQPKPPTRCGKIRPERPSTHRNLSWMDLPKASQPTQTYLDECPMDERTQHLWTSVCAHTSEHNLLRSAVLSSMTRARLYDAACHIANSAMLPH